MNDPEHGPSFTESTQLDRWLAMARAGDESALGYLLEAYRDHLRQQAQHDLRKGIGARVDASDVVQRTCLSAVMHFDDFRGDSPGEFLGWLRQIHRRNVVDEVRKHTVTEKRDAAREIVHNAVIPQSQLASPQKTPSRAFALHEESDSVEAAIERLPEMQAIVVRMKHLQGLRLREIAEQIGRSEQAIAGLLRRGLRQLRRDLDEKK